MSQTLPSNAATFVPRDTDAAPGFVARRVPTPSVETCFACDRSTPPGRRFCPWCTRFLAREEPPAYAAGLFRRAVANLLDLFLWACLGLVALLVSALANLPGWLIGEVGRATRIRALQGAASIWEALVLLSVALLLVALFGWLFAHGTTLGKAALGLRVVRTDGRPPGFGTMAVRETVGKSLSLIYAGVGFLWGLWDPDRQAWHDKLAGTVVLHRRA